MARRMTIQTVGLREQVRRLDAVGDRARDLRPALVVAGNQHWRDSEQRRFATTRGLRKDTSGWVKEKRRRGLDTRTMRATGKAERALTTRGRGRDGVLFKPTRSELVVGVKPGSRVPLYYVAILASKKAKAAKRGGGNVVTFDKKAKEATVVTVGRYVATGELR